MNPTIGGSIQASVVIGSKIIRSEEIMPYKSLAQERFFNANRKKLEKQGVDVNEWNQASKGMKLPKRASAPKKISVYRPKKKGK